MAQHLPKPEMILVAVGVLLAVTAAAQTPTATGSEAPPASLVSTGLTVQCHGSLLSVYSINSPMEAVLREIAKCTGASVEVSPQIASEPVAAQIGPVSIREALAALLTGSLNYILAGPLDEPNSVSQIIVTARTPKPVTIADATAASAQVPSFPSPQAMYRRAAQMEDSQVRLPSGLTRKEAAMTPQELYANFQRARQQQVNNSTPK